MAKSALVPHIDKRGGDGGPFAGERAPLGEPSWWLGHRVAHDKRKDDPWDTDDEEGGAPAKELVQPAPGHEAEQNAKRNPERVQTKGGGAALGRVVIGDH
jgi:hypothetical protein